MTLPLPASKVTTLALALLMACFVFEPTAAKADLYYYTTDQLANILLDNDPIANYDFALHGQYDSQHVDWPLSMLYYNNASVSLVDQDISNLGYPMTGDYKAGYFFDKFAAPGRSEGFGSSLSFDNGPKTGNASMDGSTFHTRTYGGNSGGLVGGYAPDFGYFVFGTTHIDHRESCACRVFGDSESSETELVARFRQAGFTVYPNYSYTNNIEYKMEEDHRWRNNGWASYVRIP